MPIFTFTIPSGYGKPDIVSVEAVDFEAAVRAVKDMRAAPEVPHQLRTVEDVLYFYLNKKDWKPGAAARGAPFVRRLSGHIGTWPAASFDQNRVDEFREMRLAQVSPQSFCREMKVLKAAFNFAMKRKRLPAMDTKFEFSAPELRRERILTRVEVARILRASRIEVRGGSSVGRHHNSKNRRRKTLFWWETFIWIALFTGARPGAIEALTWDRIDWDMRSIDFRQDYESNKRRVVVPIARALMPALRRAYRQRDPECPYVLGKPTGDSKDGQRNVSGIVTTLAHRAGIDIGHGKNRLSNYVLRHTTASLLLREGVSPWAVAGLLGISTDRLMKTYAKHIPSHLRESIDAL